MGGGNKKPPVTTAKSTPEETDRGWPGAHDGGEILAPAVETEVQADAPKAAGAGRTRPFRRAGAVV